MWGRIKEERINDNSATRLKNDSFFMRPLASYDLLLITS